MIEEWILWDGLLNLWMVNNRVVFMHGANILSVCAECHFQQLSWSPTPSSSRAAWCKPQQLRDSFVASLAQLRTSAFVLTKPAVQVDQYLFHRHRPWSESRHASLARNPEPCWSPTPFWQKQDTRYLECRPGSFPGGHRCDRTMGNQNFRSPASSLRQKLYWDTSFTLAT